VAATAQQAPWRLRGSWPSGMWIQRGWGGARQPGGGFDGDKGGRVSLPRRIIGQLNSGTGDEVGSTGVELECDVFIHEQEGVIWSYLEKSDKVFTPNGMVMDGE
jgi:hypothetical protein